MGFCDSLIKDNYKNYHADAWISSFYRFLQMFHREYIMSANADTYCRAGRDRSYSRIFFVSQRDGGMMYTPYGVHDVYFAHRSQNT